jgi:hypothetical protein
MAKPKQKNHQRRSLLADIVKTGEPSQTNKPSYLEEAQEITRIAYAVIKGKEGINFTAYRNGTPNSLEMAYLLDGRKQTAVISFEAYNDAADKAAFVKEELHVQSELATLIRITESVVDERVNGLTTNEGGAAKKKKENRKKLQFSASILGKREALEVCYHANHDIRTKTILIPPYLEKTKELSPNGKRAFVAENLITPSPAQCQPTG